MSADTYKPDEVIGSAETAREIDRSIMQQAFDWFEDYKGEMFERDDAVEGVAEAYDIPVEQASRVVNGLTGDTVDPVVQVRHPDGSRYVGIIDYRVFNKSGAYGYVDYSDSAGRRKRVVCAMDVQEKETDEEIAHATEGMGTAPDGCGYDFLVEMIEDYYERAYDGIPEEIQPGASLVDGTTIASNTAWHAGNDGQGSGLNADTVQGNDVVGNLSDHESASKGVHGVGSNNSVASDADISTAVSNHTSNDVHDTAQPPESHGNGAHSSSYIPESDIDVANGVAGLGGDSLLSTSVLPDLAINQVYTVADETERLNLDGQSGTDVQQGDVAVQTDDDSAYIANGGDVSTNSGWTELGITTANVDSVFGRTGAVTASSGDYSYSDISNADSGAVSAVDSEVDAAATSVALLDDQVSTNITDISNLDSNKLNSSNYTPVVDVELASELDIDTIQMSGTDPSLSVNGDLTISGELEEGATL